MPSFAGVINAVRPWPVYLLAAAMPISIAAVNVSKALLLLTLAAALCVDRDLRTHARRLFNEFASVKWVLLALAVFGLSLAYTVVPLAEGFRGWAKYAKLLFIPLLLLSLRTQAEAMTAVRVLLIAHTFVLVTTLLLAAGLEVPWVEARRLPINRIGDVAPYVPYSSYLDQSMMTAAFVGAAWFLGCAQVNPRQRWMLWVAAGVGAASLLTLIPGRSGQVALIAVCLLAMFWNPTLRQRPLWSAAPLLALILAFWASSGFTARMGLLATEAQAYQTQTVRDTSTGVRLTLWESATALIAERPLLGHGAGSVTAELQRVMQQRRVAVATATRPNAHEEYLQWGVQLGVPGILLLVGLLLALAKDLQRVPDPARHMGLAVLTVFALVCLFNSALTDAFIGEYFCAALGLMLALGVTARTESLPPAVQAGAQRGTPRSAAT